MRIGSLNKKGAGMGENVKAVGDIPPGLEGLRVISERLVKTIGESVIGFIDATAVDQRYATLVVPKP